jgi:phosphopantothenoylcysteine decarboxylase/phosphopantothenate--cysteine ligase
VIHTAAVSDYKPTIKYNKKIESGIKGLKIVLKPTPKIIERIKKIRPGVLLVGFKFAPNEGVKALLNGAQKLIERSKLDLAVANTICGNDYKAYILNKHKVSGPFLNKDRLVKSLVKEIGEY